MKKKKKRIGLLAGLCIVALLSGAYYGIRQMDWEKGEETQEAAVFFQTDTKQIRTIQVKSDSYAYTLEKDGETWVSPELKGSDLDQSRVESMLDILSEIQARRVLTDLPESLESYGLENPAVRITLELEDGSQREIRIGNTAQDGNDYAASEEDVVSTISVSVRNAFDLDIETLIEEPETAEELEPAEDAAEAAETAE